MGVSPDTRARCFDERPPGLSNRHFAPVADGGGRDRRFFLAEKRVAGKELRLEGRYDKSVAEVAAREERFRPEIRKDRDAEIQRFQEAQKALTESNEKRFAEKDEQIASLTKEVSKRVDDLLKGLGGK